MPADHVDSIEAIGLAALPKVFQKNSAIDPLQIVVTPQTATELIWKSSNFGDGWGTLTGIPIYFDLLIGFSLHTTHHGCTDFPLRKKLAL